jgi:hypothetical protein
MSLEADYVDDDEVLYRSVRLGDMKKVGDALVPSSQAFTDRQWHPSVDRAKLRNNDPKQSQIGETDVVVSVVASTVRGIQTLRRLDENRCEVGIYVIDVRPDPILPGNPEQLPPNPAHALIYAQPEFASKSLFRRLCERLAELARIELLPPDVP